MITARIRWCTCRVENILTLGKLLSLWFCFLLHSILFLISQTSYRTYKIISSYELTRPVMGTIFLVATNGKPLLKRSSSYSPVLQQLCLLSDLPMAMVVLLPASYKVNLLNDDTY